MSDAGMMRAGRKVIEARGQPNANETADRAEHGSAPTGGAGGNFTGEHPHIHAMRAHAAAMAAHSNYMADAGGAEHAIEEAREGHLHSPEAGQGDQEHLHSMPGSGVGSQREAFSGARAQGQLGKQKSVPLP